MNLCFHTNSSVGPLGSPALTQCCLSCRERATECLTNSILLFKLLAACLCIDSILIDYPKDGGEVDDDEEEVRRLVLFSVRIGTCKLPTECSYTKVYGNLCSPSIQTQVYLVSSGYLLCYSGCLGVTLLL